MNTRAHSLEATVTPRQVLEVTKALLHTILFHRTTGKYTYNGQSGTFSVGSVGVEDQDCLGRGFTYVRCNSAELDQWLTQQIENFSLSLCQQATDRCRSGRLTLEFYERKKTSWLFPAEITNWEVWHIHLAVFDPSSEEEWESHQQKLADQLREHVLYVADVVSRPGYVPRNPTAEDLANVFDTRFPTVQPYLHRVNFELGGEGVAGTVRKFLRDTFTY